MTTHICCPPELNNMTKFLKIPYTFDLEYGEIRVVINWNIYPYWLEFIVLESYWRREETISITQL